MLAVDNLNPHAGLSSLTALPALRSAKVDQTTSRHPPRKTSLGTRPSQTKAEPTHAAPHHKSVLSRIPQAYREIKLDKWTQKIFSIISNGPAGGFVAYAISPMNELFVDRTGNRAGIDEVVSDLLPEESCRYIAYKMRYGDQGNEKMKIIWIMWTPNGVEKTDTVPFINGLAPTLIGLNCSSSIPIFEAKTAEDLSLSKISMDLTNRRPSESSSPSLSAPSFSSSSSISSVTQT